MATLARIPNRRILLKLRSGTVRSYLLALRQKVPQTVCLLCLSVGLHFDSIFRGCLFRLQICSFVRLRIPRNLFLTNCCFLLPDSLPPSQSAEAHSSDSRTDSSRKFQQDASPSKPQTSRGAKDQTSHYPQNVQSDQLQRGVVLGPPGSPQGVRSVSQAQQDDRLKKLERRVEELARMLDMVKTQVRVALRLYDRP